MRLVMVLVLPAVAVLAAARAEAAGYPYQSCFEIASRLHDVPLDVLLAVAATESGWDPDARSTANAHGIMQIQWPGTARHLGVTRVSELYNPCLNIELGARYLRELLDANGGDLDRALAAYNYGPGRIGDGDVLPAGASRYVRRVGGERQRILDGAAATTRQAGLSAGRAMRFDVAARARRFADTLNARVTSARFDWGRAAEGYSVTMRAGPGGLNFQDAALLETLGWPGMTEQQP